MEMMLGLVLSFEKLHGSTTAPAGGTPNVKSSAELTTAAADRIATFTFPPGASSLTVGVNLGHRTLGSGRNSEMSA